MLDIPENAMREAVRLVAEKVAENVFCDQTYSYTRTETSKLY